MKIKTSEATGPALDYLVAKCEGEVVERDFWVARMTHPDYDCDEFTPSTNWCQGGPIIDEEKIGVLFNGWDWFIPNTTITGKTLLIAAMRYYVLTKLGEKVEVPNELI